MLTAVAVAALAGCAGVPAQDCTTVGAVNGVGFDLAPFLRAQAGRVTVRVCAADDCVTERVAPRRLTEVVAGTETV